MSQHLRLGVNIDHVATVRNARGGKLPDPLRAAALATKAGADGITAHLREDRRHIMDADIDGLMRELKIPLNFEMAATPEMIGIALRHKPHAACIVPEKREERTTEGGLDAAGQHNHLAYYVDKLGAANIRDSIEPRAKLLVRARAGEETARQGAVVEAGAADQNRQPAAGVDVADGCRRIARKLRRRIHLSRIRDVDEVVWNAAPGLDRHLVGADVETAVHGSRIAVDDLAAMPLGQRQSKRAFA